MARLRRRKRHGWQVGSGSARWGNAALQSGRWHGQPAPARRGVHDGRRQPHRVAGAEPSWYLGDGALLFNQAVAALAQLPGRIVPLDPVLGRSLGERMSGGSLGVRVSRTLTTRLSAELSVDYGFKRLRIAPENGEALEATRASFIPAFEGMIRFNPNRVLNSVTSSATLEDGGAREIVSSGAVLVNLRSSGAVIPYAAIGAGLVSITGDMPSVVMLGNYQFRLPAGPPDRRDRQRHGQRRARPPYRCRGPGRRREVSRLVAVGPALRRSSDHQQEQRDHDP